MDLTKIPDVAFLLTIVIAFVGLYPALCFLLSRIYRRSVIRDAETVLKGES